MKSLRAGYWNLDAENKRQYPTLAGVEEADVVVVGGGFSGMWTALDIKRLRPDTQVVLLERDWLGFGPSGRAGGIVYDWWYSLPRLSRLLDPMRARRLAAFSEQMITEIESLPDIDWQRDGVMHISTAPDFDDASTSVCRALLAAGRDDLFRALGPDDVQSRIRSPLWRGGTLYPRVATLHPGKLVRALRLQLERAGVVVYEGSEVLGITRQGALWVLRTPGGSVRAERVVHATGSVGRGAVPGAIPSSSHMIVSEPLANIEEFWPSGVAATDERATVRYMRKTRDGRIAFGWGFGRADASQNLRQDYPDYDREVANVFWQFFPYLRDRKLEFSWGGPVDISPTHLPVIKEREPRLWSVVGYTGNGIGPSRVVGRMLASHVLEIEDEAAELSLPRPLFSPGRSLLFAGNITRSAMLRKEDAMERGKHPGRVVRALAALPGKVGIELGR